MRYRSEEYLGYLSFGMFGHSCSTRTQYLVQCTLYLVECTLYHSQEHLELSWNVCFFTFSHLQASPSLFLKDKYCPIYIFSDKMYFLSFFHRQWDVSGCSRAFAPLLWNAREPGAPLLAGLIYDITICIDIYHDLYHDIYIWYMIYDIFLFDDMYIMIYRINIFFTGPRCLWGPVYGSRCL